MKNVYVLMNGCIGDSEVVGVFSSLKEANEAKEWIIQNNACYKENPQDLYTDVFELDGREFMNRFKAIDHQIDFMDGGNDAY